MSGAAGNMVAVDVATIRPIERPEATELAEAELLRCADALEGLDPADWTKPTANHLWDVRAMAGHMLGMAETFTSFGSVMRDMKAAAKLKGDGPQVDGLTAQQVRLTAGLTTAELIARLRTAASTSPRWRAKRRFMRAGPMTEEVPGNGGPEKWRMGYVFDTILTRDPWMHRSDLAEATGKPMHLTADHDGRIVADAVREWAGRHGKPFILELTGPAGGTFVSGDGGEHLIYDAIAFCRIVSGRPTATEGLLAVQVPF